MGYIKKLKNNELVGGTDKTTVYPVTSTKAVFEEVSENSFKSQKYLNNNITGDRINKETITDDNIAVGTITKGKLSPQVQTMLDEGQKKALTPKGNYNSETEYEALDLVFDPVTNSSYISLQTPNAGHPVDENAEGYEEGWWEKTLDGTAVNTAQATINAKVDELDAQVDQAIEDARQELQDATDAANDAAGEARDAASTVESLTALQVADAQVGYFECTDTAASGAAANETKLTTTDTIGESHYIKTVGSHVKIKMAAANTHAAPVYLQFGSNTATRAPLLYNGLPVSASNSWDEGEVISVYYDGSVYQASNAQGGGGKAEKIKYDNSQSGLAADNVQGALDSIVNTQTSTSAFNVTWEQGTIDTNTGEEKTSITAFRSSPISSDKFTSVTVSSPSVTSGLRLYNGETYLGSIALAYGGGTADVSSYNANKIRIIIADDARTGTTINATYQTTSILDKVNKIEDGALSDEVVTTDFTDNITWERGSINPSTGEETTADAVRSSVIKVNGRFLSCSVETELSVTIAIRLYHNNTYITSVTLGTGGGTSPNLYSYNANKLRVISAGHKLSGTSVSCQYIDEKKALPIAVDNRAQIIDIKERITSDDVIKSFHFVSGSNSSVTFEDVYPAGTYVLEVTGSGAMSSSVPSTWPDWLHVFIKDLNDTTILTPIEYIYGSTFEDMRVRFHVGESFRVNPFSYYDGDITMHLIIEKDSVNYLNKKLERLEVSEVVTIGENDVELDLSTEVMGLTGKSTTNYRYDTNNNTTVSSNSWILIEDTIPANPGFYYVADGTGAIKLFQIAYLDGNGNVVKVHGTDNGTSINAVSKYFIEALNVVSMKIAVKATSPTSLHFINGRKYVISDTIKRAAFYNQCSDGKINLAYISGSNTVDRFSLASKIAGEFGIVKVPSGRYEIGSTLWLGAQGQSYEFASDAYIVASSSFNANYLVAWGCAAYEMRDQDFPNSAGEDSAMTNAHIYGGVFDVKGKGGCLRLYGFRGFEIKGCTFYNAKTSAFSVEPPGYELILHNCFARNSYSGLKGNVAYNIQTSDCHFHDLIAVNYSTGFRVHNSGAVLARCHPWTAIKDFSEYYPDSIGFDIATSTGVVLTDCYSDTMQTHYKTGNMTKMIGCTALSSRKDVFPIDLYGDVNIIDNDKQGVVLIGCLFRCSGTTIVENSGSVAITKIGCT